MKIDNHILALSMEFEKNNLIINEFESDKAKKHRSKKYRRQRRRNRRSHDIDGVSNGSTGGDADNEESGFEEDDIDQAAAEARLEGFNFRLLSTF
jgi:hypothetical protein